MLHRSAVALVFSIVPSLALAQTPATKVEADDALFLKLTTEVQGAIQAKDMAALDRIFAKDFAASLLVEGKRPEVLNRSEFLRIAETVYRLERFEVRHLSARVLGSTAVVRFQPFRQASVGGVERSGEYVVVDTWVKEGDAWRLLARYLARPVPAPAPVR